MLLNLDFPHGPAGGGRGLCDGPSVVAEHDRWTVYSSKVNLPAALNDPRLAKRESDFFTKTWGLDFAETEVMPSFYLPNITREHFGPYLQEMAQVTPTVNNSEHHCSSDLSRLMILIEGRLCDFEASVLVVSVVLPFSFS